jgi:hypothetical protein
MLAQPAADLALDQRGAGQEPKPEPQLVAVIFREFDGLGLGIKDHDAFVLVWRWNGTVRQIRFPRLLAVILTFK